MDFFFSDIYIPFVFKGIGYNKKLYLPINYFKTKEKNEFFLTSIFNQNAIRRNPIKTSIFPLQSL